MKFVACSQETKVPWNCHFQLPNFLPIPKLKSGHGHVTTAYSGMYSQNWPQNWRVASGMDCSPRNHSKTEEWPQEHPVPKLKSDLIWTVIQPASLHGSPEYRLAWDLVNNGQWWIVCTDISEIVSACDHFSGILMLHSAIMVICSRGFPWSSRLRNARHALKSGRLFVDECPTGHQFRYVTSGLQEPKIPLFGTMLIPFLWPWQTHDVCLRFAWIIFGKTFYISRLFM